MSSIALTYRPGRCWVAFSLVVSCSLVLAFAALGASVQVAAAAAPPLLVKVPEDGKQGAGAGRMSFPGGIASDPQTGHVYVADGSNRRVDEFTAWGEFVKAWGWGVRDGSPELQVCTALSGCVKGLGGGESGEFVAPTGVAVGGEGGVYVVDRENHRVQKFDREGHFLLMFGGDVDKTRLEEVGSTEAQRNLCTAASGDSCQVGTIGVGNGQFKQWASARGFITVGPSNAVYVGDEGRIQQFDSEGHYVKSIVLAGQTVRALAADPAGGALYVANTSKEEVQRIGLAGETICSTTGVKNPVNIAPDSNAHHGFYVDDEGNSDSVVRHFDSSCKEEGSPFGEGEIPSSFGLVTGSACYQEGEGVYVTNGDPNSSFLNIYGPAPDKHTSPGEQCQPPKRPPSIVDQYASSVESVDAIVDAHINPHFWVDTRYYVEYGTGKCSEGGCDHTKPLAPGSDLTTTSVGNTLTAPGVVIEELEPGTTYHYRFVAQSTGGGPVYGVDPDGEGPGEAGFSTGSEASFRTESLPVAGAVCAANEGFRVGASALLPDCRAYELVSPLDKENSDVVPSGGPGGLPAAINESSLDGERLTYGAARSFAGAEAAPNTTQYIADRREGVGWVTHPISPPHGKRLVFNALVLLDTEFELFSPDLCHGWFGSFAEVPGVEGAPEGVSDLYRRNDDECGGVDYKPLNTVMPPSRVGEPERLAIRLQGVSTDGETSVFAADDELAAGGHTESDTEFGPQLYVSNGTEQRYLCVLPDGSLWSGSCMAGWNRYGLKNSNVGNNLTGAVSADGKRVFWTATSRRTQGAAAGEGAGSGQIYLRENPFETESAHVLGGAIGSGDLTGPVVASGNIVEGSVKVKKVKVSGGEFVVGQEVLGRPGGNASGGIPVGTTIVAIEEPEPESGVLTLTLSKAPTVTLAGAELVGVASEVVANAQAQSGAFAVGQEFVMPESAIPVGAKIENVEETATGVFSLTLSAKATRTEAGASLRTTSACSEAGKACTVAVSQAAEEQAGSHGSEFVAGARDGSSVLFITASKLYEFSVSDRSTHLIANISGVLGQSSDVSRVYLKSASVLSGANGEGKLPISGQENLYLYEKEQFHFIGIAQIADTPDPEGLGRISRLSPYARVSASGLEAVFGSTTALTGYDNLDAVSGKLDIEVFRYDERSNEGAGGIVCISCDPTGARPRGNANVPAFENDLYASRALSDDGSRLFFESSDSLVLGDTNGARDVYEWEEPGHGTCTVSSPDYSARNGGCVALISSGKSAGESTFLDASPNGSDVFFATASSLVVQDIGLVDVYDARVDGGFAAPRTAGAVCEGEACQSPAAFPLGVTPGSLTFSGPGDLIIAPSGTVKTKAKSVRNAQKLARALRACRREKHKRKRAVCEAKVRKTHTTKHASSANTTVRKRAS